jgi:nucleotidyltransferase/DNA polymerase involved in DNA repair
VQVAELIRSRMRTETRLTCSAGVAPNKRLAKVCSDINKPDGQYVLPASRDAVLAFISSLPIRKVGE